MAAAVAYDPPTLPKAWQAVIAHLPTIALIWGALVLLGLSNLIVSLMLEATLSLLGWQGGVALDGFRVSLMAPGLLINIPTAILANLLHVLFLAVPAMHYESGAVITPSRAFALLLERPLRLVLAGLVFAVITTIGYALCFVPGLVIALITPVFVNRIVVTDLSIGDAFASSFQAVYRSPGGLAFIVVQVAAVLAMVFASLLTCGLGVVVALPMACFYVQNAAYQKGVLS